MLQTRNVMIGDRRTSMRLEPEIWAALRDITEREQLSMRMLCARVAARGSASMTSRLRVFVIRYFRYAAEASDDSSPLDRALTEG